MNFLNEDSIYAVFGQVMRYHYLRNHALLEKLGIYPGQPPLLFFLGKQDGQSQKELAEKLHIKAATITVMLKRMEAAKLVERRPDSVDQRVTRVYLTDYGKKVLQEVKESLKVLEAECFANFTPEEQILLRRLLMQMRDNLMKVCEKKSDG
ncbi:MAG: MarR family transcriptional regulator [Firmicutes bacterium]|nr:MarR family transcriptional regulator [Bacillota bacterium]